MRTWMVVLVAAAVVVAAGLAQAAEAPGEPLQVTNFGKKDPVTFDHARHLAQQLDCERCHHNAAEGSYKCGACHGAEDADAVPRLKDAMHKRDLGVCYACHLDADAAHKLKCAECHKG